MEYFVVLFSFLFFLYLYTFTFMKTVSVEKPSLDSTTYECSSYVVILSEAVFENYAKLRDKERMLFT